MFALHKFAEFEKGKGISVIFRNCSYEEFIANIQKKKIIQFGASSAWHYYLKMYSDIVEKVVAYTEFIVDNNPSKQGSDFEIGGSLLPIRSVEEMKNTENFVVLIVVSLAYQEKICEQLINLNLPENIECYSLPLMAYHTEEVDNSCVSTYFQTHTKMVNLPKIHSFWFSGEDKPDLYKRCINSWREYCPEFEIIEWNAQNYDITKNKYMQEAYEHRKWAFVSDYARLDVIYNYGGIYLDMDVELKASLQPLLHAECFFCRQEDGFLELGSGFGATAENRLIGAMLESYRNRCFVKDNGELDLTPQPEWLSGVLREYGIERNHNSQIIGEMLCLSNDYISCFAGGEEASMAKLGIHWHNGGWLAETQKKLIKDSLEAKAELMKKYFKS